MPSVSSEFNGTQAEKEECISATVQDCGWLVIFFKLELFNTCFYSTKYRWRLCSEKKNPDALIISSKEKVFEPITRLFLTYMTFI